MKETEEQTNPFILYTIFFAMTTIMYLIAFHQERDENKDLKEKLRICQQK